MVLVLQIVSPPLSTSPPTGFHRNRVMQNSSKYMSLAMFNTDLLNEAATGLSLIKIKHSKPGELEFLRSFPQSNVSAEVDKS